MFIRFASNSDKKDEVDFPKGAQSLYTIRKKECKGCVAEGIKTVATEYQIVERHFFQSYVGL